MRLPFLRIALCIIAALAPFFFPWPLALALGVFAGLFVSPMLLVVGVLLDLLYYGGHGVPYFSLIGAVGSIVLHFVHQFIKERIM